MPQFDINSNFASILGQSVAASSISSLGGAFTEYVKDFKQYANSHWVSEGADWASANYYDRAKIYYEWWASTGDPVYLERANALALDYRTDFLEANNYGTSAHWSQMGGIALHYALTGDPKDLKAIGAVADTFAVDYYLKNLGNLSPGSEMDNRQQARLLESFLYAWKLDAPSTGDPAKWITGGNDWAALLRSSLTAILSSQGADGGYHMAGQKGFVKPFMVGQLNDALILYYTMFEKDPRILDAIKKSVDYLWANTWDAKTQSFYYLEGYVSPGEERVPAPDLNNLIVNGFGFVHAMTGDETYKQRGDQVFAGGVNGSWLEGSKQFNEQYTSSYKYFALTHPELDPIWTGTSDERFLLALPNEPSNKSSLFGDIVHDRSHLGGQVQLLYEAVLDRDGDLIGLEGFADSLEGGATAKSVAMAMLSSAEFTAGSGSLAKMSNGDFVSLLYENALDRPADAQGLAHWTGVLAQGASRADVAIRIAFSSEHLAKVQPEFANGFFVPDADAANVARLYHGILDRTPDVQGLAGFEKLSEKGVALTTIASQMLASAEFKAHYGTLGNEAFVRTIYENALDRSADTAGLSYWTGLLARGVGRAEVAVGITQSVESLRNNLNDIEAAWAAI